MVNVLASTTNVRAIRDTSGGILTLTKALLWYKTSVINFNL
jgi:hypothetical protein